MALEQLTHGMEPETLVLRDDSRECRKTELQITTVQETVIERSEGADPFDSGLTLQEAAYVYGYSKKTLKTLIEEGRLPAIQVESGRKKKLKWKVFPAGVPLDFFEAIASSKNQKAVAESFPAPPIESADSVKVESAQGEIAVELPAPTSALNELELEAPVKEKKHKKKKNKNKHKEEKSSAPETGAIDFSIPAIEESPEEEWTAEQEALFNALLARLYSDEQEAAESDRPLTRAAAVGGSKGSVMSESSAVESSGATTSLEALLAEVGAHDTDASCSDRSVAVVVEDSRTVFDALDENGLLSRLANLEDEVSRLMHKNSNLENRVAELESTLKMLGGTSKTKMSMQSMLFMIPFLLVLCVAATVYLR